MTPALSRAFGGPTIHILWNTLDRDRIGVFWKIYFFDSDFGGFEIYPLETPPPARPSIMWDKVVQYHPVASYQSVIPPRVPCGLGFDRREKS